jgi:hypothetical protein
MSNDYFPVFLYRWDDANEHHDASTVSYGEKRIFKQHHPDTVIGVATRPVGEPIEHHSTTPKYADELRQEFREHVESVANQVRWFETPLYCNGVEE